MKQQISQDEFKHLQALKRSVDAMQRDIDLLVDQAAQLLGETEGEVPDGLAFEFMHNCSRRELRGLLKRFGVEVK